MTTHSQRSADEIRMLLQYRFSSAEGEEATKLLRLQRLCSPITRSQSEELILQWIRRRDAGVNAQHTSRRKLEIQLHYPF
jgi:hypothetical protein